MRTIKYRGWGIDAEMMHQWEQLQKIDKWWNHDAVKLMQFTGLLDKFGKEIYEGDIISMHNKQYNVVVEFTDYGYQGLHKQSGYYEGLTAFIEDHEIIGDKYSNPELLN